MSEPQTESDVDLHAPGFGLKFKGQSQALLAVLLIILVGVPLGMYSHQHESKAAERQEAVKKASTDNAEAVRDLTKTVKAQGESIDTIIYVLTLPQSERDKLRLREPDKLREMKR